MKKIFLVIAIFFAQMCGVEAAVKLEARYIYEVKKKDAVVSYVFGGMHRAHHAEVRLSQCVKNYLMNANVVVFELNIGEYGSFEIKKSKTILMQSVAPYLEPDFIKKLSILILGGDSPTNIRNLMNMRADVVDFIVNLGGIEALGNKNVVDFFTEKDSYGTDSEIILMSRFLNKQTNYIESGDEQWDGLYISPSNFALILENSYVWVEKARGGGEEFDYFLNRVINMYRAAMGGDDVFLSGYISNDADSLTRMKGLIVNRNPNMANKIDALISMNTKSSHFIALGAAHLPGDDGVIELLRKLGYQVTRLCSQ